MKKLQNLSDINTNTKEGRYLMAALVKITTESQTNKTPDEVLEQCYILQEEIYKDAIDMPQEDIELRPPFVEELQCLINRYSIENESNTPDFILAKYMLTSLINWQDTCKAREEWYGKKMSIGME